MAGPSHHILPLPVFETPPRLLIVTAPYYLGVADMLRAGARARIAEALAVAEEIEVPGALEIPAAISAALVRYDGFVALGCVVRGETSHYDIVAGESARALVDIGVGGSAVGNGILTVDTLAQAEARADPARGNKGAGAADAALHLIAAQRRWAQ